MLNFKQREVAIICNLLTRSWPGGRVGHISREIKYLTPLNTTPRYSGARHERQKPNFIEFSLKIFLTVQLGRFAEQVAIPTYSQTSARMHEESKRAPASPVESSFLAIQRRLLIKRFSFPSLVVRRSQNEGPFENKLTCIPHATGRYFASCGLSRERAFIRTQR